MTAAMKTAWLRGFQVCACALALAACVVAIGAQDNPGKPGDTAAKPAAAKETERPADNDPNAKPIEDGYDRPTTYPRIRMGSSATGGAAPDVRGPAGDQRKLKTRAYLLDTSISMAASITVGNSEEMTRLERMVSEIKRSLDTLAKRRDLRFNVVTFGTVSDLCAGGDPWVSNADTVKKAKEWLTKLEAKGTGDLYALLKAVFEQEPESASMMVGSMPGKPEGVSETDLKKFESVAEFLLAKVKDWRGAGKSTTLDITGIGLGEKERAYYKRLAEAAGGTYLDA